MYRNVACLDIESLLLIMFGYFLAPLNQPVEIEVHRLSETSIHAYWRGFSTTYIEEPLEGYKVLYSITFST